MIYHGAKPRDGTAAMIRTYLVTGAASGIGAATARRLRADGGRVITSDRHDADVLADLASADGRRMLVEGVASRAPDGIDGIVANAGGGPPETSVQLNFFGTVATLEGLRPLLASSAAPRAVAVSSIASLRAPDQALVDACLRLDERAALVEARRAFDAAAPDASGLAAEAPGGLTLYGSAKYALGRWCRTVAVGEQWAGGGVALNVVALGFYDTPAAAYIFSNPDSRAAVAAQVPLRGAFPGRPDAAAALLAWLVSAENSQLTGQVLFADGGFECRAREQP